ncbi:Glycoside-Pentoside-Hexuronide:Cation Symporter (MFS) [Blattamonas nauphoetae]|uniref:Glycoside-Pentoside-Hexuronide:Cation Symporter (MFS) n=1 Tax=Blattamonas nauphoetae TaxID=2049346 RepID=A0ABQ9X9P8_9EUKA|nr:Glycoside-Pentoside-Hexuronide:Cation Symporter (MFS) [Blattamonas nauphoetae]
MSVHSKTSEQFSPPTRAYKFFFASLPSFAVVIPMTVMANLQAIVFWLVSNNLVGSLAGNVLQPTARALISDLSQPSEHARANAILSFVSSSGTMMCFLIVGFFPQPFLFAIGFLVGTMLLSFILIREPPDHNEEPLTTGSIQSTEQYFLPKLENEDDETNAPLLVPTSPDVIRKHEQHGMIVQVILLFVEVWKEHGPILGACLASFVSAASVFPTLPIRLTFVGEVFYKGQAGSMDYEKGIKMGSYAMMGSTFVSMLFSFVMTPLLKCLKPPLFFALCHLLAVTGSFLLFILPPAWMHVNSVWIVIVIYVLLLSTIMPASFSVPFIILAANSSPNRHALYIGVMNVFTMLGGCAGLLLNVLIEWLASFDKSFRHHTQYTWLGSSVLMLAACCLSFLLKTKPRAVR